MTSSGGRTLRSSGRRAGKRGRGPIGCHPAMSDLDEFRASKDAFLRDDTDSPLTADQRKEFTGLRYFPESEALRLRGRLETEGVDREEQILMQTTSGGVQE